MGVGEGDVLAHCTEGEWGRGEVLAHCTDGGGGGSALYRMGGGGGLAHCTDGGERGRRYDHHLFCLGRRIRLAWRDFTCREMTRDRTRLIRLL